MSGFTEFEPTERKNNTDPGLEVVVHKLTRMASDMDKMAGSVEELSKSMNRLVLVEERISQNSGTVSKIVARLESVEKNIGALEKITILNSKANMWVDRGIIALLTGAVLVIANKLGIA